MWNTPFVSGNICQCDWLNKEADCPIAGQNKFRQENQTKDTGVKGRVRGVTTEAGKVNRRYKMKERETM